MEILLSDHLSLRAEGLYYQFGQIIDTSDLGEGTDGDLVEFRSAFVVRVGLSFLIGPATDTWSDKTGSLRPARPCTGRPKVAEMAPFFWRWSFGV